MNRVAIDLTVEDIERLAAEVWDVAAKEALAKGLPVTGYHDGHLFRYHPGKGIEDFAPEPPSADIVDDSQSLPSTAPMADEPVDRALGPPALPAVAFADSEAPAPVGVDEVPPTAAVAAGNDAAAHESLSDFGVKAIEFARQNAHATLELTAKLMVAKSFAEMVELSTAHAYKQFEAFSAQSKDMGKDLGKGLGKDLAELASKPAADAAASAEPCGERAARKAGPAA